MAVLCAVAGVLVILLVLGEAFEALVLPRRVTRPFRVTRLYYRAAWRAWKALAPLLPPRRRETWLSVFGPLSLLTLFALWAVAVENAARQESGVQVHPGVESGSGRGREQRRKAFGSGV